jgi:hypothetical protein
MGKKGAGFFGTTGNESKNTSADQGIVAKKEIAFHGWCACGAKERFGDRKKGVLGKELSRKTGAGHGDSPVGSSRKNGE